MTKDQLDADLDAYKDKVREFIHWCLQGQK